MQGGGPAELYLLTYLLLLSLYLLLLLLTYLRTQVRTNLLTCLRAWVAEREWQINNSGELT